MIKVKTYRKTGNDTILDIAERVLKMERAKLWLQAHKSLENKILVKIRKLRA